MRSFTLDPAQTVLLVVDMQQKIFCQVERGPEILHSIWKLIQAFQIMELPIIISEQYPKGLGSTLPPLQTLLGESYKPWEKTTFSCMDDPSFKQNVMAMSQKQWVVVGIEAHICVLQTVKGLLDLGKEVVVLNDSIASRSIFDYSTAIAEMRDEGARISSTETILFELLKDSKHPQFKAISELIKTPCCC